MRIIRLTVDRCQGCSNNRRKMDDVEKRDVVQVQSARLTARTSVTRPR